MIFNIQNENNTYKKISIVSKNSLGRIFLPIPGPIPGPYNPTLTLNQVDERDVLNVCLAPLSNISCEGATYISILESIIGAWSIEINDVLHLPEGAGHQALTNYINGLNIGLEVTWGDEHLTFKNYSSIVYRICLIPRVETSFTEIKPTNNPTFTEHENGSLTFCLVPALNEH